VLVIGDDYASVGPGELGGCEVDRVEAAERGAEGSVRGVIEQVGCESDLGEATRDDSCQRVVVGRRESARGVARVYNTDGLNQQRPRCAAFRFLNGHVE
jgi:hypothetical protein